MKFLQAAAIVIVLLLIPANSRAQFGGASVVVRVTSWEGGPLDEAADVMLAPEGQQGLHQTTGPVAEAQFDHVRSGRYDVEVKALGYKTGHATVEVDTMQMAFVVSVSLQPDSEDAQPVNNGTLLAPKARKEMEKGDAALKAGKFAEAEEHLKIAYKLAPGDPDINYMLGYASMGLKEYDDAQKYLLAAISLKPQHTLALIALGRLHLETGDPKSAAEPLEQAISFDSSNWRAHWLLAEAYLRDKSYEEAAHEAGLAVKARNGAGDGAQLILGQALAALGRNAEAIAALNAYLIALPNSPSAATVRSAITVLQQQLDAQASRQSVSLSTGSTAEPDAPAVAAETTVLAPVRSEPAAPAVNWAPPMVDETTPIVAKGVVCPASQVIQNTGERMLELVANFNNIDATEEMVHERLDGIGKSIETVKRRFDYLVSISEVRPGLLDVEELRNGTAAPSVFPGDIVTRGVPALALVFHPDFRSDYEMTCAGQGELRGHPTWIVDFKQKDHRPSRLRLYRIDSMVYPVSLEGRAWIDAETFQVMRLETDMIHPMPEIQLLRDYIRVDYKPVQFQGAKTVLWLPSAADMYFDFRHERYHRHENLSRYRLFSVGATQQINQPASTH
ncbi:MAG TPA: tetratricopeptide repeat protein [Candidatus Acidoferrales bacterium]|nr:tetratricopeptide repeat protein [Candidatus Acidoferrales bacterium]